ncbi:MAG TPA: hypothetical protein VLE99_04895 [Candidatus Saccharimonadales bacterium]|nr:hypothetical protein [Candidatus Saccharimonadales bacterium]
MARVHQSGFELNSTTANVEWNLFGTAGTTITSGAARSGGFGLRISSLTSGTQAGAVYKWLSVAGTGPYFFRAYVNVQTLPSGSNHIMSFNSGTGTPGASPLCKITLESNGTLILRNQSGTQIGSASSALSTGTWYMLELKTDTTAASGSRVIEGRLNGSVFATTSTGTQTNSLAVSVGGNMDAEAQTTGEWWFDDIAVNDSTGSFQTSYPGDGKIIHLKPNAAGDANGFATQVGGTAGSTNNYTRVNEVPPDNTTSYNQSGTLNTQDMFNVDDSGIGSADTVNVVMVGIRIRNDVADAALTIKAQIEKTSGGTIAQGSAIIANQTSFGTNQTTTPHNYTLVTYQDPDSGNWARSTLDSMQIGYKITVAGTNNILVTNVWAIVDYTPSATVAPLELALLGVG